MLTRIRTGYSFHQVAIGELDEVIKCIDNSGWNVKEYPITDRASCYGWYEWRDKCLEHNKHPIFGVELEVSPDITAKRPASDLWTFYPCFVYAPNTVNTFIRDINKLISLAYEQFRYRPLLSIEQALDNDLIKIMGHRCSFLGKIKRRPRLFAGLSPSVTPYYFYRINKKKIPWVVSGDNFYPSLKEKGIYEIITGTGKAGKSSSQTYPTHILSKEEWITWMMEHHNLDMEQLKDVIYTTNILLGNAGRSNQLATANLPDYKSSMSLYNKCRSGAMRRGMVLEEHQEYVDRLNHELEVIQDQDFEKYFHIVGDIVRWANKRTFVGPGRGSAAGSLVCYLLGITNVDPVEHGLFFERFIDKYR